MLQWTLPRTFAAHICREHSAVNVLLWIFCREHVAVNILPQTFCREHVAVNVLPWTFCRERFVVNICREHLPLTFAVDKCQNICPSSAKSILTVCNLSVCHWVFSQGSTHNNRGTRPRCAPRAQNFPKWVHTKLNFNCWSWCRSILGPPANLLIGSNCQRP